ncbi:MAG: hypothetical protein V3T22_03490 [Planctomycetota bacterium]
MLNPSLLAPLIAFAAAPTQDPAQVARKLPQPGLRLVDLPRWREHLRPSAAERTPDSIEWIAEFGAGMRRADAAGKPLVFWAMNGHPLACT